MKTKLSQIKEQALKEIKSVKTEESLDKFENKYLGRKAGRLTLILRKVKDLSVEEKKNFGKEANKLKNELESLIKSRKDELRNKIDIKKDWIDVTLPGRVKQSIGHMHPSTKIQYELEDLFRSMGFMVLDGPELESEYYNFDALNMPAKHPARDMQDTFWLSDGNPLRTQTSAVQVRAMEKYGVPIRAIVPGRCFRYEPTDASHENTFYQLEGLMVDKNISIANLIATMKTLLEGVFKKEVLVRLRPGYFPFVEPGFELDMSCLICGGKGCSFCKQSGWVETMPCGMVHPVVLKAGGADPEKWSGFAFGLGLTRLALMKYGIDDIRLMNSGDLRFLNQF